MSLPNILTLFRIALIPVIVTLILLENSSARWWAFALFSIAAITDYLDGMIARKMQLISPLGRMLDPIADKLLVGALLIVFSYEGSLDGLLVWTAIMIMMREISVSGLREFLGSRQVIVNVSALAKYKTTLQLIALGGFILSPLLTFVQPMSVGLMWLATLITLYTGYEYFAGAWPHLTTDNKQSDQEAHK